MNAQGLPCLNGQAGNFRRLGGQAIIIRQAPMCLAQVIGGRCPLLLWWGRCAFPRRSVGTRKNTLNGYLNIIESIEKLDATAERCPIALEDTDLKQASSSAQNQRVADSRD